MKIKWVFYKKKLYKDGLLTNNQRKAGINYYYKDSFFMLSFKDFFSINYFVFKRKISYHDMSRKHKHVLVCPNHDSFAN